MLWYGAHSARNHLYRTGSLHTFGGQIISRDAESGSCPLITGPIAGKGKSFTLVSSNSTPMLPQVIPCPCFFLQGMLPLIPLPLPSFSSDISSVDHHSKSRNKSHRGHQSSSLEIPHFQNRKWLYHFWTKTTSFSPLTQLLINIQASPRIRCEMWVATL